MRNLLLIVFCLALATSVSAQSDTLALDPAQFVNIQILGDTLGDGSQVHSVYTVERSTFYAFDGRLDIDFPCEIIGPDNGPIINDDTNGHPPVLVQTIAQDGTVRDFMELQAGGTLVLKNLVMSGLINAGATKETVGVFVNNTGGSVYTANNVVFTNWANFAMYNRAKGIDITVTDCVFINGVRTSYSPWGGFPIRMNVAGENVLIENNTVVNSGRLLTNSGPFFNATIHELHNSYLNSAKAGHEQRAFEMIQANNIYYNYDFLGRRLNNNTYDAHWTTWNYYADVADKLDSNSLYLGQNLFFREQALLDWFDTAPGDTLFPGLLWEHPDVDSIIINDDNYTIGTNYAEFDPEFTMHPGNTEEIIAFTNAFWYEDQRPVDFADWRIENPVDYDAGTGQPTISWPPDFDLSYTNDYLQTAGSDGLPLGDLNWFPDAKTSYLANRAQHIAALRDSIENATGVYVPETPIIAWQDRTERKTPMITPDDVSSVADKGAGIPAGFALGQNYPNPFNPTTTIVYSIGKAGPVTISLYNTLGQKIKTLVDGQQLSGEYTITVDGSELSSGIYFYSIDAGDFVQTKKMILMK